MRQKFPCPVMKMFTSVSFSEGALRRVENLIDISLNNRYVIHFSLMVLLKSCHFRIIRLEKLLFHYSETSIKIRNLVKCKIVDTIGTTQASIIYKSGA